MMRFKRCLNTTFFIRVHLCPSVVKKSFTAWIRLTRIFHSHIGKSREKPYENRGANTFEWVVEKTRHAGLETCDTAGWEACATTLESRRVNRRIVARLQRFMATVAANPGRCHVAAFQALYSHRHSGKRRPWIYH
jgi:hypothetical protein